MKIVDAIAKGVFLGAIWFCLAAALIRGAVPFLWGSRSDFGMLAAVAVGAVGLAGLILLAGKMIGAVMADLKED